MTSLNVAPIHTVENIKIMLWHRLGIPPDQQCLYLRNDSESELNDDCLMGSCPNDCKLYLAQRPKAVFIRRNSGPSVKLDWPSHSNITTSEIKSALQEKERIQAEKMTLALGLTVLRDKQCLCSYSILNQMRKESYCLQLAENHAFFIVQLGVFGATKERKNINAECIAEELVKIFSRRGIPKEILTNQDSDFTA